MEQAPQKNFFSLQETRRSRLCRIQLLFGEARDWPRIFTNSQSFTEKALGAMYQALNRIFLSARMKKGFPPQKSIESLQTDASVNELD